jgi:hypothetical protein
MSAATDATLVTTGMLPGLMLVSAALAAPVSIFLLRRYRRAVLRAMSADAGVADHGPNSTCAVEDAALSAPAASLRLRVVDTDGHDRAAPPAYLAARRALLTTVAIYVAAGLAYALVLSSAWLVFTRVEGIALTRLLWLMACYSWPTVLAVAMIAAVSRSQRIAVTAAYFGLLFVAGTYALARNADLTFAQLAFFWVFANLPATLLLLAFLRRSVRAVGPLVLAFMVAALAGSQVLLSIVGAEESALRAVAALGAAVGVGAAGMIVVLMLIGFGVFGVGGWWLLGWIGRRYQQRRMSDQSLTLDAMWLLFGIVQSITLAFEGVLWIFTGVAAFALYKIVTAVGFAATRARLTDEDDHTLLLLRVFSLGSRSERLFDALSRRWLRAGSITMIAGPDLVTSTVEPHEFLEFMGGRLSRRFVRGSADLDERLRTRTLGRDPDGRYRVNEFFCHADTWQATMARLAWGADAVLMDLRSFSPGNAGCVYELQQLIDTVPLERVVFTIDPTTDRAFLQRTLEDAWRRMRADSPNRTPAAPEALLVLLTVQSAGEVRNLMKLLLTHRGYRQ